MQDNILRDSLVTSIYLSYMDQGKKQVIKLKLRFMDAKQAYFSAEIVENYVKPKRKTEAVIKVYSIDGVYKTNVVINDVEVSLTEIFFEVSLPKIWEFIQQRNSSRNRTALPVLIKYNDGFEIDTTTYDIALGGIAFYTKEKISSIYKRLPAVLTLTLPSSMWIKNPDGKLIFETLFVRERVEEDDEEHFGDLLYSFKFINPPKESENLLKEFLIQANE